MKNSRNLFVLVLFLLLSGNFILSCSNVLPKKDKAVVPEEASWLKPGLLNSKRIELKFGSYGVETIAQSNPLLRLSNLYSLSHDRKYARTIALTQFRSDLDTSLRTPHQEIVDGGSIGIVLGKHGFSIKKDIFYVDELINLPASVAKFMGTMPSSFAAIIYDLSVEKDGRVLPYCTILEVYNPEFLSLTDVKMLYKPSKGSTVVENISIRNDVRTNDMVKALQDAMATAN